MTPRKRAHLVQDVLIIALSIVFAVVLVKTDILATLLASIAAWNYLGSFIAGLFFTSVFTTAPAIVALGEIAQTSSIVSTAFFGAIGAVLGDLLIFTFVEDRFSKHVMELVKHRKGGKRIRELFKMRFFRYITFLVGGLLIASPLPDEIGISLLGFSKMKATYFVALSFVFNFIGIIIIGFLANAL